MKKKSAYRKLDPDILAQQFGDKTSWRFVSITTPGCRLTFARIIAEFVIVQRHGFRNVPPYFWHKKTGCQNLRKEFKDIENQIAAMIYRKNGTITAQQLLSIVCEKYPPPERHCQITIDIADDTQLSDKSLIELHPQQINNNDTRRNIAKRIGDLYGEQKK